MPSVSTANRTVVIALLVLVAPAAVAAARTCDSSPLVVRNVRVWTPEGLSRPATSSWSAAA
jgi:hypothetical protein